MKLKRLFSRKKNHRREPRANAFVLESLEPRLLLSATPMTAAVVTTDHVDYAPGETAVITTSNTNGDGLQFRAGELVRFQVSRTDGIADAAGTTADVGPTGNEAWYVADGVGGFRTHLGSDVSGDGVADWIAPDNDLTVNSSISTTWFVEEQYRNSSLVVTAAGQESGAVASQAFTDAAENTTTTITSSGTSTYGEAVTFTATVTAAVGANGSPTGTVEFYNGATLLGTATTGTPDSVTHSTSFSLTIDTLSASNFLQGIYAQISAKYISNNTGDTGWNDSTSGAIQQIVNQRVITGWVTAANKVYDGTTAATETGRGLNGVLAGDEGNVILTNGPDDNTVVPNGGPARFESANADNNVAVFLWHVALTGTAASNYRLFDYNIGTLATITARDVTGHFTAANKVYDGTTAATVLTRTLTGVLGADDVQLTGGTATFDTADAGLGKTVTLTGATLIGAAVSNYRLASVNTTTADITALGITVTGHFTADSKVYDGTTAATVLTRTLTGVLGADDVQLTGGTATFDTANAGLGKTVTLTGATLTGAAASNYSLVSVNTTTADITARDVTGSFAAVNKVYDGTTAAAVQSGTLTGTIAGDDVNLGGTATFDTANAGLGKTVTLTGATLTGAAAGNYTLTSLANTTTTADITALGITGHFTADSKVYDGTTAATVLTRTLTGVLGTDDVQLTGGTATFDTANAGLGKTVTLTDAILTGAAVSNYSLVSVNTTTADITTRDVTGSFAAVNKVYDGTTAAAVQSGTLTGTIAGDDVNLGGTATFDTANAGLGKTVTLTGATLTGAAAGNYTLTSLANTTTTADITALGITGHFTADSKVYDGTTAATVLTRTLTGVLGTDDVQLTGGTATFDTANAGLGKTVTLTDAILTGAAVSNYSLVSVNTTTADITALGITVTGHFTADSKVYDGTTAATVLTRTLTGVLGTDDVQLTGGTATFDTASAGLGKTVTLTGATLTGAAASNYSLVSVNTTTADITARDVTGSFAAVNKVYDGTTAAAVQSGTLTGTIAGDDVNLGGTATFDTANAGLGKTVTLTGATLIGAAVGNYTLTSLANTTTTADITALGITGHFAAVNKVYDGTTAAAVQSGTLTGTIAGDDVNLGGTATFDTANAGLGKTVTLTDATLIGAAASNYSLVSVNTTTADITARDVTGSFAAVNKVYDGTTAAAVQSGTLTGTIAGDDVNLGGTATFDTADAGLGKTVTLTGATLTGAAASNYSLVSVNTTTADITTRDVTGSFAAVNKVYDGTTAAAVQSGTLTGTIAGDDVNLGGTATFDTANAGLGKTVTLTGATLTGAAAGNYTLTSLANTTTTADITALGITGHFTADSKVYDGTTAATVLTRTLTGVLGTDDVQLTGGTATFDTANAGLGKTVTLTDAILTGAAVSNYSLVSVNTTTADITALGITVTGHFTADSKVYDGTTAATVLTRTLTGVLGTDDVQLTGGTATFADANVGLGKTVTLTGATLTGTAAGNYSLLSVATATADITALGITGFITVANKVYDGTTAAAEQSRGLNGVLAGDVANVILSNGPDGPAAFQSAKADFNAAVYLMHAVLTGTAASNYRLTDANIGTTANIDWRNVTGSFAAVNKVYDGTTAATVQSGTLETAQPLTLTGVIAGDDVNLGGTATFDTADAGLGKTVTLTGATLIGTAAGNYRLVLPLANTTTTADITKASATVNVQGYTGTYDGAAHGASGTATGLGGVDLSGGLSLGASFTNAPGGTANWTFSGGTNYNDANGSVAIVINKANAVVTLTSYVGTYDGAAHQATGTATGVLGESLSGLNLSVTSHSNAGVYIDTVTFTDGTGNYKNTIKNVKSTINKANAVITLTSYVGTYDGAAHQATGTATGVLGESLSGLNLSVTSHSNAGVYIDTVAFTDVTGNYKDTIKNVKSTINKANAVITLTSYVGTYDGAAHQATGTATGVLGESLSGLNLSVTSHSNAGVYIDTVTFTDGTGNYKNTIKNVKSTIRQANAVLTVTGYSVTFDGLAHTATGTATGVLGEDLSAGLDLSSTTHTNVGSYLNVVTFTDGTGNYKFTVKNVSSRIL